MGAKMLIYGLILYTIAVPVTALVGYDCSHNNLEIAAIDITTTNECNLMSTQVSSKTISLQLIQLTDILPVTVYKCQVSVFRSVQHCGMHSHISAVKDGMMEYPLILNRERCMRAVQTGELCLFCETPQRTVFTNLVIDSSLQETRRFAGMVDEVGNCKGGIFSDQFGTWDNVIVQGWIRVSISKIDLTANTEQDVIHLPNSVACKFSKNECKDSFGGEHYWESITPDSCYSNKHMVLYQGPGNITEQIPSDSITQTMIGRIVTVIDNDVSFSLQLRNPYVICNQDAYTTEHPRLIIIIKTSHDFHFMKTKPKAESLDLFTYMNAKFVFIERNIQMNMEQMYNSIMMQKCSMEQETLKIKMAIAEINPQQFAYLHTDDPGYHATRIGEVLYMTKCSPVIVQVRKTENCYDELPIIYHNESYFLSPRTRLIQKHGTEIMCNSLFPPLYKLDGVWYQIIQRPLETKSPTLLGPTNSTRWRFKSLANLATSGIYSQTELETLRDHLMYGNERKAIENIIVRGASGYKPDLQGLKGVSLLDPEGFSNMADEIASRLWGWFSIFGTFSSGIIGLVFLCKILKWVIDAFINGTILFDIYGFSYKMFGCFFDSITTCLVHRNLKRNHDFHDSAKTSDLNQITIQDKSYASCPDNPDHANKSPISTQNNSELPISHPGDITPVMLYHTASEQVSFPKFLKQPLLEPHNESVQFLKREQRSTGCSTTTYSGFGPQPL